MAVESLAHVARRQAAPDHVGEVRRDVIERLRPNQRFVRRRQQRETRAEAGAEDADPFVALPRQPLNRAPRVEHRLAAHLHRAGDVGADDVVGALELGRHPLIVIRQARRSALMPLRASSLAQADMAAGVGSSTAAARAPPRAVAVLGRGAGKYRQYTVLFSACGVSNALGNVSSRPPSLGPPSRVRRRSAAA